MVLIQGIQLRSGVVEQTQRGQRQPLHAFLRARACYLHTCLPLPHQPQIVARGHPARVPRCVQEALLNSKARHLSNGGSSQNCYFRSVHGQALPEFERHQSTLW